MAERKSGPVKPPVIEGTARATTDKTSAATTPAAPATESKPEAVTPKPEAVPPKTDTVATKPIEPPKTPKPTEPAPAAQKPAEPLASAGPVDSRPKSRPAPSPWPAAVAGTAGGAIIGLALAYGLASAGLWPASQSSIGEDRLLRLEQEVSSTNETAQTAISDIAEVSARSDAAQASINGLSATVSELKAAGAPDLSGIEANLKTLSDRIDAIGAGASSADAGALAENLARLQTSLAEVTAKVTALTEGSTQSNGTLETLTGELQTVKTALAAEVEKPSPQAAMGPALRLPLVLSGLEAAFSSGRPFAAELASLREILPETAPPAPVAAAAETGLTDPRGIADRFNATLPDIVSARPANPDASWNDAALDWLKNVLVLRPSGDVKGDSPDAVLARLETAISAGDFATATALFASLPQPMQEAAGALPQDVTALADADAFIATLRTSALADTGAAQ